MHCRQAEVPASLNSGTHECTLKVIGVKLKCQQRIAVGEVGRVPVIESSVGVQVLLLLLLVEYSRGIVVSDSIVFDCLRWSLRACDSIDISRHHARTPHSNTTLENVPVNPLLLNLNVRDPASCSDHSEEDP